MQHSTLIQYVWDKTIRLKWFPLISLSCRTAGISNTSHIWPHTTVQLSQIQNDLLWPDTRRNSYPIWLTPVMGYSQMGSQERLNATGGTCDTHHGSIWLEAGRIDLQGDDLFWWKHNNIFEFIILSDIELIHTVRFFYHDWFLWYVVSQHIMG